jgi:uncharacterized protein
MYLAQRKLQYHPNMIERQPTDVGLDGFEQIILDTQDGERILSWYHPPSEDRPTILYFHGNGHGISDRAEKLRAFVKNGFGILAVSYRGFEGSTGSPSETGFMIDANTAYNWLQAKTLSTENILLLGESMGTGVAVQLAAKRPVRAMVLEAPYANAVDVGAQVYWFMPVRLLMKDQFRSMDFIKNIHIPILMIHGNKDQVIPFTQGQKLFAAANEPKQFIELDGAGHGMIFDPETWSKEAAYFNTFLKH